ncbi:hypothetical protein ACS5NO_29700 [Larkinella sp. GY13]
MIVAWACTRCVQAIVNNNPTTQVHTRQRLVASGTTVILVGSAYPRP